MGALADEKKHIEGYDGREDTKGLELRPFALERYFAQHEFTPGLMPMCCSDPEPLQLHELLTSADTTDELRELYGEMTLAYTESEGDPMLRDMVVNEYDYRSLTRNDLLVAVPEEGVLLTMMAADFNPGDVVVCMTPCYQSLSEVARSRGAAVRKWEPTITTNSNGEPQLTFDVNELRRLVADTSPKMIVTNFPHNPTGCMPSIAEFEAIVDIARDCGAIFFSDEMYRTLELEPSTRLPSAVDMDYERAVVLHGLSKTVGCPGLRIGWIATHDTKLLAQVAKLKDYTTICAPRPSEVLAMMAIANRETLTTRTMDIVRSNLELLDAFFERFSHVMAWQRPTAGTIGFPRLVEAGADVEAFCDAAREKGNVLLLPSHVYTPTSDLIGKEPFFRLGFGRATMPDALARLERYLLDTYGPRLS